MAVGGGVDRRSAYPLHILSAISYSKMGQIAKMDLKSIEHVCH